MWGFESNKKEESFKKVYTYSFLDQWRETLYIIVWIIIALFFLSLSQKKGAVIFLSVVTLIFLVTGIRDQVKLLRIPWKIIVTETGITGIKRGGQRIEVRWEEIEAVRMISHLWSDIYPSFLIETSFRLEKIIVSSRLNNIIEMMKIIEKKAVNCREMEFLKALKKAEKNRD